MCTYRTNYIIINNRFICNNNIYYIYSTEEQKYIGKTPEEMKKIIDNIDKDSLNIIGTFDRYNPREIDELEL